MCLLTIATGASRRFPIIILNNRDEYVSRSTSALKLFGAAGTPLCGGEPSEASTASVVPPHRAHLLCAVDTSIPNGGTWMGVNVSTGAFACVTNSPQCGSQVIHMPSVAPSRITLAAASGNFDFLDYVKQVLFGLDTSSEGSSTRLYTNSSIGEKKEGYSEAGSCCGLRQSTDSSPRPYLAFKAERSRGCIVGEYLSESKWARAEGEGAGKESNTSARTSTCARCWQPVLPANVVLPPNETMPALPLDKSGACASYQSDMYMYRSGVKAPHRDLFYDGYNLVCGNLVGIAEGLRRRWEEEAPSGGGAAPQADLSNAFLYTTNRQSPFPLGKRRQRDGALSSLSESEERRAVVFSPTWSSSITTPPAIGDIILERQPAIFLGDRGRPPPLSVSTLGNTFLDNPLEPKSLHLTASVKGVLERLLLFNPSSSSPPPSPPSSTASLSASTTPSPSQSPSSFVEAVLVPALAECLCDQPGYEIDITEPNGAHLPLLAISPMGGLTEAEYRAALRSLVSDRLAACVAAAAAHVPPSSRTATCTAAPLSRPSETSHIALVEKIRADPAAAVEAIVSDVTASRPAIQSRVAAEEQAVHSNVYTHLTRGAVGDGVFKTRTQTICVVEDLSADNDTYRAVTTETERMGAHKCSKPGAGRYRLHYYMRDSDGPTDHKPWQIQVVDLSSL